METKICNKCGEEKLLEEFYISNESKDGYRNDCKICLKKYREKNKEKIKKTYTLYRENNKDIIKEKTKIYHEKNKEKNKLYREKNKLSIQQKRTVYYQNNKDNIKEKTKIYREKNKDILMKKNIDYVKLKRQSDSLFKIKDNIRRSISRYIRKNGYCKKSRTHEILGCSFDEFKSYLESKFAPWMTWENYGLYDKDKFNYGWDIDHIIPVSSSTTEDELIQLNHYTNLQPLCSKVNRNIKRDIIYLTN